MTPLLLIGLPPVAADAHIAALPEAAAQGKVLLGLVPIYAFALIGAIATFWWVSRLIASDTPDDDDSDEGGGGGGPPRYKPRPHGPFGDGPAPIEPVSPPVRPLRGDVHEVPVPGRRRPDHAPRPVQAPLRFRLRRD